jgi:nucleoside-diphosphate-sugar epimerase
MKTLLLAGYGDIARRAAPRLEARFALVPLARRYGSDLDRPETLASLPPAHAVLHCAPPPNAGLTDTRTAHLLTALAKGRILPARLVYVSTSGVYGDCGGAHVDESRAVHPQTDRARRRVDAERQLAQWCSEHGVALAILRAPGIYAADRLPLERLRAGTPVLRAEDDVYTNHIHAEDLAAIAVRALEDTASAGIYNASDDSEIRMGEWFDLLAARAGLPKAPRIARAEAAGRIAPALLSFMSESRRLLNRRIKEELGVRLQYPTVYDGVPHWVAAA